MMEDRREQGISLREIYRIAVHGWWVIGLCLFGALLVGYFYSQARTIEYRATARVLVEGGFAPQGSGAGEGQSNQDTARIYSDLITTKPVLDRVKTQLGLFEEPVISAMSFRSFIDVSAKHRDPTLASEIANVTAEVFIQELRETQFSQIANFQASLAQYGVSQDPAIIASQTARVANLRVIEPATLPHTPIGTTSTRIFVFAFMAGILIAGVIIVILEQLRETAASSEEIKAVTGLEVLGSVTRYRSKNESGPALAANEPRESVVPEAYAFLWTNLEFASLAKEDGLKTILVTSAGPSEGKSTTVVNLASVIAKDGKRVIVVDCDLRRPSLHKAFSIKATHGLTSILLKHHTLQQVLLSTSQDGLKFLPAGPLPPDPGYALRSSAFRGLVSELKDHADVVIIDSPPVLAVADPLALAPLADAVLLVMDTHGTTREALKRAAQLIRQAQPSVAGVVLNKMDTKGRFGYHYYQPYYYYYHSSGERRGSDPGAGSNGSAGSGRRWRIPGFASRKSGDGTSNQG